MNLGECVFELSTYSKIDACYSVHDDEDVSVCQLLEAEIQASWNKKLKFFT